MVPEIGALTICAVGVAMMNAATAFARALMGNQWVRYTIMPGKNPASARPKRNRST